MGGMAFSEKKCSKCKEKKPTKGSTQKQGSDGRPVVVCGDCVVKDK